MEEPAFIKRNLKKWKRFEHISRDSKYYRPTDPDELASGFIELTDDLAYARTFFPESNTTLYLNELAARMHARIYKNKRARSGRFMSFWRFELPLAMFQSFKPLALAFAIFVLGVGIGVFSTVKQSRFTRQIMGDQYVDKTIDNIESGDPMAVYSNGTELDMFLGITVNNIRVSFMAFAGGALLGLGTLVMLLYNGIMLGTFHTLLAKYGALETSLYTVYIHGTLEISAIILAGAAGFVLAGSILFPGTHTRGQSLLLGAKRAVKMVIGLVPVFVAAGFLESFATRFGDATLTRWGLLVICFAICFGLITFVFFLLERKQALNVAGGLIGVTLALLVPAMIFWNVNMGNQLMEMRFFNIIIILLSASFILFYFVIYPILVNRQMKKGQVLKTEAGWEVVKLGKTVKI